ncbi:hypothetical protein KB2_gp025 [Klebsiella phage vB_KleM_KB2]|uniref:Uncharacterized protein n=1 Tax=Klebsiella phage vB_KleM_KB2 TaxID=2759197 RepID=A0AAE7M2S5_9CAUD|nr:hypothetical protein KB2_gp025 [Klebsiella phage vB_KleM_KB2]
MLYHVKSNPFRRVNYIIWVTHNSPSPFQNLKSPPSPMISVPNASCACSCSVPLYFHPAFFTSRATNCPMVDPTISDVITTGRIPIRSLLRRRLPSTGVSLHKPNRTGTPRLSGKTPLLLRKSRQPFLLASSRASSCTLCSPVASSDGSTSSPTIVTRSASASAVIPCLRCHSRSVGVIKFSRMRYRNKLGPFRYQ